MRSLRERLHRGRAGAAIVETAIVLTLLLTIVFAIFDLGRGFMVYLSMNQAASLGVDYGTKVDSGGTRQVGGNRYPGDPAVQQQIQTALTAASVDLAGLTAIQVNGTGQIGGRPALEVTVQYGLPMIGPFLNFAFSGGVMRLNAKATRMYPE